MRGIANIKICLIIVLGLIGQLQAQNHLSSPYSRFGLGELNLRNSHANTSMGGVSYAHKQETAINFLNPASYAAFDSLSSLVDAAFSYKYHALEENTIKQTGGTMSFDYLALGVSIVSRWSTVFGFQPYSFVNYNLEESLTWQDTIHVSKNHTGTGGLYQFYLGNAVRIYKELSIGFNASYLFGNYTKNQIVNFSDELYLNYNKNNHTTINGALFSFGTQYFIPIKKYRLGMGITYTPSIPTVFAKQSNIQHNYINTTSGESMIDTLCWNENKKTLVNLPQIVGVGISWSDARYFVGFDFTWSNWSRFQIGNISDTLKDSYKYALGGSIIPNPTATKYVAKIKYSLGAYYELTSLYLKGTQIDRLGLNVGLSFPMKKTKTRFNVCFEYGQWGTLTNNLLQETYFLTTFSIALHERWYQRRKLD